MATKSGILGLIIGVATVLIIASAVGENADYPIPKIGTVEESGFSESCVETGCYTPSVLTIKIWYCCYHDKHRSNKCSHIYIRNC